MKWFVVVGHLKKPHMSLHDRQQEVKLRKTFLTLKLIILGNLCADFLALVQIRISPRKNNFTLKEVEMSYER